MKLTGKQCYKSINVVGKKYSEIRVYLKGYQKNIVCIEMWEYQKGCIEELKEEIEMYIRTRRVLDKKKNIDTINVLNKLDKDCVQRLYRLKRENADIIKTIEHLNNATLKEVLYRIYIKYQTIEKISDEMGYSYTYVSDMHTKALGLLKIYGG